MANLTINGIRRNSNYFGSGFQALYENLLIKDADHYDDEEGVIALKWAIFFINSEDEGLKRLGYRIIVRYSVLSGNYIPLYDVAFNLGFIPIAKFIEEIYIGNEKFQSSFNRLLFSSINEFYRVGDHYLSFGQKELLDFNEVGDTDTLIVAPTSYGKSDMIVSKVAKNLQKKIVIVVPSKALLAQTKRRLMANEEIAVAAKRIITYPEMYRQGEDSFVAVLTQERLLRLFHLEKDICFDLLLIDEAHNLLEDDARSSLLLEVILISKNRNRDLELKFYTPFIASPSSLESPFSDYSLDFRRVTEYLKIEKYFIYDLKEGGFLKLYDQFVDKYIDIDEHQNDEITFLSEYKSNKNIIYLNKPRDVEDVARRLQLVLPDIPLDLLGFGEIQDAYDAIADFVHPEYKLLACLKKGIIYHHGRIPEIIRLYLENLFSSLYPFTFIVTTSTLLEGVNIPAQKIFILDVKKGRRVMRRSSFKNLTGRVCRFSEIFSPDYGDLALLEPEIYIINGNYMSKNFSVENFFKTKAKWQEEAKDQDDVNNILLKKDEPEMDVERVNKTLEYIENVEPGTIAAVPDNLEIRYAQSDIAKACFKNNIHEFDIHFGEEILNSNLDEYENLDLIADTNKLVSVIADIFIKGVEHNNNDDFVRLQYQATQNFYSMVLSWKLRGASFKEMINAILRHWEEKERNAVTDRDYKVYVGNSWGEVKLDEDEFLLRYVDLREKNRSQRINLAIVRIKEEQDFVEYNLMKYIEILNDLGKLEPVFYEKIKYGSSDPKVICMLKNGISMELSLCLLNDKYAEYLDFDLEQDKIEIDRSCVESMERENENKILIFETIFHAQ